MNEENLRKDKYE